jgi:hypothetical protein
MAEALSELDAPRKGIVFMTEGDGDHLCADTEQSGFISSTELGIVFIRSGLPVESVISTYVAESALQAGIVAARTSALPWRTCGPPWRVMSEPRERNARPLPARVRMSRAALSPCQFLLGSRTRSPSRGGVVGRSRPASHRETEGDADAEALLGRLDPNMLLLAPVVAIVAAVIARLAWRHSLRSYTGANA